jgi:hypothetical protein
LLQEVTVTGTGRLDLILFQNNILGLSWIEKQIIIINMFFNEISFQRNGKYIFLEIAEENRPFT